MCMPTVNREAVRDHTRKVYACTRRDVSPQKASLHVNKDILIGRIQLLRGLMRHVGSVNVAFVWYCRRRCVGLSLHLLLLVLLDVRS